ncbi:MAG: hypothetical protein K9G83_01725 [Hyphomonadaceae bacterium]|jgi:hypothetical protein|nr:hypothetical protein [Hyphomonadaceae bacterium]
MAVALMIAMGALGLAAIAAWLMAIRTARRIPQAATATPGKPRNLASIIRAALSPTPEDKADPALQKQLRAQVQIALACLLAMAIASFALPLTPGAAPTAVAEAAPTPHDPTGTTLTYIRSNQDGTLPERIIVHIVSPTEVHVAKMVAPCTDAAYVTAAFDPATQEATHLVGGRLTRESTQNPQAFIDLIPATRTLEVRLGDAASAPAETHPAPPAPWRIYDFDLAEFAIFGPRARQDFTFGFAMAWPDGTSPTLRILGAVHAKFLYSSEDGAKDHYRLSGPAFTDPVVGNRGGELIADPKTGHVIEARFGRPNHPGYDNFMLKLIEATPAPAGAEAWRKTLADHWSNCPAKDAGG